jgi:hypothetical protein
MASGRSIGPARTEYPTGRAAAATAALADVSIPDGAAARAPRARAVSSRAATR